MTANRFSALYRSSPCILGEGAVIERLRRDSNLELDSHLVNAAFIYSEEPRAALETICRQYLEIGRKFGLPLLMSTPTWRASQERIAAAGYDGFDVNGDNSRFLDALRATYGSYASQVIVCGLMSCRGNAYSPAEAMDVTAAQDFHSWQAARLAEAGVDVILASTLPALSEATGLALALAATRKPYLISFVARPEGTLLDGTPLHMAISSIDVKVTPQPFAYMINCTHASFARTALLNPTNSSSLVRRRIVGLLANTAALSPEELDGSDNLVEENPATFGKRVAALHCELGLKIMGGCCGTDERHIGALAAELTKVATSPHD
jgi:homocysteine S-methyltransferase